MHLFSVSLLCAVGLGIVGGDGPTQGVEDGPLAVTPAGSIRGSWMTSRRGRRFEAYRGIRYAEPPVGELRFQLIKYTGHCDCPVSLPSLEQYWRTVDASVEGPACPQPDTPRDAVDEDCLRLNVYTPKRNSVKPLPVVVFIHQGGFYSVSGRSDVVGPNYLMDRDLVLVAINYRLGSLGFLSTGDAHAPGNNGFKDQVAALRWVRRNIAAFGGDPKTVTLAGYSAGSYSIALHMVSPMSRGLFHRAVSMSGSPYSQLEIPFHQRHLAEKQARLVGCPTDNSKVIVDCLKSVPWRDLGNSLIGFAEFAYDPVFIWKPVIEQDFGQEVFLPQHPLEALRLGQLYSVPYIISQTRDEFFWKAFTILRNSTLTKQLNEDWYQVAPIPFMLPGNSYAAAQALREAYLKGQPLINDTNTAYSLGRLYGDSVIGFGVHRLANIMCRISRHPVFYYQFSYLGNRSFYEDPVTNKPVAVAHHDDLIYLFSIRELFPDVLLTGADAIMVDKMTAILYNFARFGDPNPRSDTPELSGLTWPQMDPDQRSYLRISSNFTVLQKQSEERFQLWDQLYPLVYKTWSTSAVVFPISYEPLF